MPALKRQISDQDVQSTGKRPRLRPDSEKDSNANGTHFNSSVKHLLNPSPAISSVSVLPEPSQRTYTSKAKALRPRDYPFTIASDRFTFPHGITTSMMVTFTLQEKVSPSSGPSRTPRINLCRPYTGSSIAITTGPLSPNQPLKMKLRSPHCLGTRSTFLVYKRNVHEPLHIHHTDLDSRDSAYTQWAYSTELFPNFWKTFCNAGEHYDPYPN